MTWKTLLLFYFLAAVARSVNGCCGGCKFLQFRRPEYMPMYEPQPPCEPSFDRQDSFYGNGLMSMYHEPPISKFEDDLDRYLANYFEPKPIRNKPYCCKRHSSPSARMMSNPSKYYKRGFSNEALVETIPMRGPIPCGQFGYGRHEGCCPFAPCEMPPHIYDEGCRPFPPCEMPPHDHNERCRPFPPCDMPPHGHNERCRPFPPCEMPPHGHNEECRTFDPCEIPPHIFRHSSQRILPPLSMPPSCIC